MNISKDLLLLNGFEECKYFPNVPEEKDDVYFRIWTGDAHSYKIDVDDGHNGMYINSDNDWIVHIDNSSCSTVGHVELTTVEQFNKFMEVINSCFRLDPNL